MRYAQLPWLGTHTRRSGWNSEANIALKEADKPEPEPKGRTLMVLKMINLLVTDFFQILAHPVFKMWAMQKPNKVALWNKRYFEEEEMEIIQHV